MSLAVANAICNTRMRAVAALIARGVQENRIEYWSDRDSNTCGLNVDGALACVVSTTKTEELVTIDVAWSANWVSTIAEAT